MEVFADQRTAATGNLSSGTGGLGAAVSVATADVDADGILTLDFGSTSSTINVSGNLTVAGTATTTADASVSGLAAGLVKVATSKAFADATPSLTVNIGDIGGGNAWISAGSTLSILGRQLTDADSKASGTGGGLVDVSSFQSHAKITPTVNVNINDTDTIYAGEKLEIISQHGPTVSAISDGTVLSADGSNDLDGNYLTLTAQGGTDPIQHLLTGGETVTYAGGCCGLQQSRPYTVIRRDEFSIHLGAQFDGAQVDTATDTIDFGQFGHNFVTGDVVYYFADPLADGGGAIGADLLQYGAGNFLVNGGAYEVFVVDPERIRVRPVGSGLSYTINSSAVDDDAADERIDVGTTHPWVEDTPVVYHAPDSGRFTPDMVDVIGTVGTVDGDQRITGIAPSLNDWIFMPTVNADGVVTGGHGFSTGGRGRLFRQRQQHDWKPVEQHRLLGDLCRPIPLPAGDDVLRSIQQPVRNERWRDTG